MSSGRYPAPRDYRRDYPQLYDGSSSRRSSASTQSHRSGYSARDISPIGTSRFERPYESSGGRSDRRERRPSRADAVADVGIGSYYSREYHRRPPPAFRGFDGNYDVPSRSGSSRRPSGYGDNLANAMNGLGVSTSRRSSRSRGSEPYDGLANAMNGLGISISGRSSRPRRTEAYDDLSNATIGLGISNSSRPSRSGRRESNFRTEEVIPACLRPGHNPNPQPPCRSSRRTSDMPTTVLPSRSSSERQGRSSHREYRASSSSRHQSPVYDYPDFSRNPEIFDEISMLGAGPSIERYTRRNVHPMTAEQFSRAPSDYDSWGNLRERYRRDSNQR